MIDDTPEDNPFLQAFIEEGTRTLLHKTKELNKSLEVKKIDKKEFDKQFKKILGNIPNEQINRLYFRLGVYGYYGETIGGPHAHADYIKIGKKLFDSLNKQLYDLICKRGVYKKLNAGDFNDTALYLIGLMSSISLPLSAKYFVAYIILRKGLREFCEN